MENGSVVSSYLQTAAEHGLQDKSFELRIKLWAHELLSTDGCLIQSAEIIFWIVHQVPASRVYAHFCTLLLGIAQLGLWALHHVRVTLYYCSATVSMTSFMETSVVSMVHSSSLQTIAWHSPQKWSPGQKWSPEAVHHVEAVSTCQTDNVLLIVSVQP